MIWPLIALDESYVVGIATAVVSIGCSSTTNECHADHIAILVKMSRFSRRLNDHVERLKSDS